MLISNPHSPSCASGGREPRWFRAILRTLLPVAVGALALMPAVAIAQLDAPFESPDVETPFPWQQVGAQTGTRVFVPTWTGGFRDLVSVDGSPCWPDPRGYIARWVNASGTEIMLFVSNPTSCGNSGEGLNYHPTRVNGAKATWWRDGGSIYVVWRRGSDYIHVGVPASGGSRLALKIARSVRPVA